MSKNYPYNLLEDLYISCGYNQEEVKEFFDSFNEDKQAGLEYALSTLNPEHQEALNNRYVEEMTWREIGERNNRSSERERQICQKALRCLRHPARMMYIYDGLVGAKQEVARRADEHYQKIHDNFPSIPVAEVSDFFPKRAYDVLRRYDWNITLGTVMEMSDYELGRLRQCDANTVRVIRDSIVACGKHYGVSEEEIASFQKVGEAKNELKLEIANNLPKTLKIVAIDFNQKDDTRTIDISIARDVFNDFVATVCAKCKNSLITATIDGKEREQITDAITHNICLRVEEGIEDFLNNSSNASVLFGENAVVKDSYQHCTRTNEALKKTSNRRESNPEYEG